MSFNRVRLLYGVAVTILIAGYYLVPAARPPAAAGVAIVSGSAIAYGLVRLRPARWGAWVLIALAVLLEGVGNVIVSMLAANTPAPIRYPTGSDIAYLLSLVPLAVGLLWLGRPRLPSRDWPMILDTVSLSLAGSLLVWMFVVRPAVVTLDLTATGRITAIACWVGYGAVLAATARVMVAWRTNPALATLGTGVALFLIADFFYDRGLINRTWSVGTLVDLGFLGFSVLCGAAALMPSMAKVASAGLARHQLGPGRLTMLAVALLIGPTALLVEATMGVVTTGVAIAVVSGSVGVLMLVRLSLTGRAYRRRAIRERAIGTASRALVAAATDTEVLDSVRAALASMLKPGTTSEVKVVDGGPRRSRDSTLTAHTDEPGGLGDFCVPMHDDEDTSQTKPVGARSDLAATRVMVFTAPVSDLVELSRILQALADQAISALDRIRLASRLRTEEREQYFRTLVLTHTDVTLISRGGRIDYATPSARTMFGGTVEGRVLDDLLRHDPPRRAPSEPDHQWPDTVHAAEGYVYRSDGGADTVLVNRRDLSDDPTVHGVVTTLRDITAERAFQHELAYRASHDALTGLANAQAFSDQLRADGAADEDAEETDGYLSTPQTRGGGRAALFVDLDDFKTVNDNYGHQVGDRLLVTVARRIEDTLREEDLAARLGGDEFAVLLRDVTDLEAARGIAQRLSDTLAQPASVDGITMSCQASIGLAYAGQHSNLDALIRQADTALYAAKAHGKGRWWQYREGMSIPTRRHIDARRRLEAAMHTESLSVNYQPIVELASNQAVGFEALIRLEDHDRPVPPRQLIMMAEDTGLITTIGDWVLRQALHDAKRLNPPGTTARRYVSVNVSAQQLRQSDFADRVRAGLAASAIDPTLLVLEITENLLLAEDERAWTFLADLRGDGIRVAIDDYGTGYASLSYLRQSAIDFVKIDQSFVSDISSPRARILLRAVTGLCRELGLAPIAEGVQDEATRDALLDVGCRHGQGFLYAPAISIGQALVWEPATAQA